MKKLFLSYAWADNESLDVDYVVQELSKSNLRVVMDKYSFIAGRHLWAQIEEAILDPETSAYAFYTTENFLRSSACREELQMALTSIVGERSTTFPLIGLFPQPIERSLIPLQIQSRLYVSLEQNNWARKIVGAVNNISLPPSLDNLDGFSYKWHYICQNKYLEIWPRFGSWAFLGVLMPAADLNSYGGSGYTIYSGPSGGYNPSNFVTVLSYDYFMVEGTRYALQKTSGPFSSSTPAYVYFPKEPKDYKLGFMEGDEFKTINVN